MRARLCLLLPTLIALLILAAPALAQTCPEDLPCVSTDLKELCEGDLVGTDLMSGTVVRVHRPCDPTDDGAILAFPGGTPEGVTVDSRGFIYWTDSQFNQVLRINLETSDGTFIDLVAPDALSPNPFQRLEDLEFSPDGSQLSVIDATQNPANLWSVDPISGAHEVLVTETDLIGPFRPSIPQGIAYDPYDANIVYIADGSATRGGVYRVDLSDGLRDPVPITNTASRSLLDGPGGVEVDALVQAPYDVEVYDPTPGDNTPPDHVLLVSNQPFPDCCGFDPPSHTKVFVVTNPWATEFVDDVLVGGVAYELIGEQDLDHPLGLAVADEENLGGAPYHLYVADFTGGRFQRFQLNGSGAAMSVVPSTEFGGYGGPWGVHAVRSIVLEPRKPFVVLDRVPGGNNRLVRLTPDPTDRDDDDGIGEDGDGLITSNFTTVDLAEIVSRQGLFEPVGICVAEEADPADYVATDLQQFGVAPDLVKIVAAPNPDDATAEAFELPNDTFDDPTRILLDDEGNYLVLDRNTTDHTGQIVRISADGSWSEIYLDSSYRDRDGDPIFYEPAAFAFDDDGVLIVANTSSDPAVDIGSIPPLLRVLPDLGGELVDGQRVFPLPINDTTWLDATDMVIDRNGDALVLDQNSPDFGPGPGIVRVSATTGRFRLKGYSTSEFDRVNGLALDANRELLVTEGGTPNNSSFPSRVFRVEPVSGNILELFDFIDLDAGEIEFLSFNEADGIAIDEPRRAPALVDLDRDGFGASTDNCQPTGDAAVDSLLCHNTEGPPCHNPDQSDLNGNGYGDICERHDPDADGWREIPDCDSSAQDCGPNEDNCPVYTGFCPSSLRPLLCSLCIDPDDPDDLSRCTNEDQRDTNLDGLGDICQPDDADGDGIPDSDDDNDPATDPPGICQGGQVVGCIDNCAGVANSDQANFNDDEDDVGDACGDFDGDGWDDFEDNCPADFQENQDDLDDDGEGDLCDPDDDGDGTDDDSDNCSPHDPEAECIEVNEESEIPCANPSQDDSNDDGFGDRCQPNDEDDDGWSETPIDPLADPPEVLDNCSPGDAQALCVDEGCYNPFQENFVNPTTPLGDLCEDGDGDTVVDSFDNCATVPNTDQTDSNFDSHGDVCQPNDADDDGIPESVPNPLGPCLQGFIDPFCVDNCPNDPNTDQADADFDGIGDACDDDDDNDGINNDVDNCPLDANSDQTDTDVDGFGNRCDVDLTGCDNRVGVPDFVAFGSAFNTQPGDAGWNPEADANGDQLIGIPDLQAFADRFGRCAGDAELPDGSCAPPPCAP